MQHKLETALKATGAPAACVAVIRNDSIETAVAGVRKHGEPELVALEDRWHLGSNTKAMTATMIGLLVQEGVISEDATPVTVWPELDSSIEPGYRDITLEQLLKHRAGIQPFTAGAEFGPLPQFKGDAREQRLAFSRHVLSGRVHSAVGKYMYSNAGYALAAGMAEAASGQDYATLMQEKLLQPLGVDGYWGWPALEPGQPFGHTRSAFGLKPHDPRDGYEIDDFCDPAGDFSMSIGDYAVFVQAHLRGLQGQEPLNASGEPAGHGLSAALVMELHEPEGEYSYGWLEQGPEGQKQSGHEGSVGTFHAITIIRPWKGMAVAAVCNAGGDKAEDALREFCFELLREP